MKKYIITISIAVLAVIGIGVGLGVTLGERVNERSSALRNELTHLEPEPYDFTHGADNPFYPFDQYHHHIQHEGPDYGFNRTSTTSAEKHYQDLLDSGHQDIDDDNQLKYNY